ncbi:MAG: hypothetical protein F6K48_21700 [Okeania sp. SIO3H1]|uniref:hypothetical protein n=1 Tax=Okeania sp. SIO1I7 TaxID=2607772 RepID=UPI0013C769B6|nr:hypothetical protein [Okeania sp. SIO1I7]NEN91377.1 hypothetical protein [Okeania sp. SIO3H1]NET25335.1 hypothetical protein [Okeania sp. SIO1I7]
MRTRVGDRRKRSEPGVSGAALSRAGFLAMGMPTNRGNAYQERKTEEGRRLKSLKKPKFPVDIHPWVYTNDTSGHDIISSSVDRYDK